MSNLHVLNLIPIWVDQVNFIQITNLIQSNLIVKIKDTLLQTVGIADQNGGENVANANRLRACFSYKCSQGGKNKLKVTPDAVSIKQLKMIFKLIKTKFWFAFYYCFFPKEHHSSLSNSFQLSVSSRFFYFVISSQNMSCSLPPNCLLFNLLHSHHFQLWNTAYSTDLCSSSSIFHALQER